MNLNPSGCKKIAEYYESDVNHLWDVITGGYIHLGYWDETNKDDSFADGTLKLTQLMIGKTNIIQGLRFCDIGCGIGLPAILLAKTKGCHVDGITISAYQQKEAEKRSNLSGAEELTSFWVADALRMPFADASFDGGWFFESIFHMGHRQALTEAQRVLKPGAELLIADVIDIGIMTESDKQMAKDLCNASYISMEMYPDLLEETGFECLELCNVTNEVMQPFEEKFVKAVRERKEDLLRIADKTMLDAFEKVAGKLAGSAGYAIIKARRN